MGEKLTFERIDNQHWYHVIDPREDIELPEGHPMFEPGENGTWWRDQNGAQYIVWSTTYPTALHIGTRYGGDLEAFKAFVFELEPAPVTADAPAGGDPDTELAKQESAAIDALAGINVVASAELAALKAEVERARNTVAVRTKALWHLMYQFNVDEFGFDGWHFFREDFRESVAVTYTTNPDVGVVPNAEVNQREYEDENATLKAEVERLRAALEPFAQFYDVIKENDQLALKADVFYTYNDVPLRLSMLKAAAQALGKE